MASGTFTERGRQLGRRRHQRWDIRVAGCYRSPSGSEVFVSVRDISRRGCCVANPSRNLFVGDRVTVFIDGLDPVEAQVRWHDRGLEAGFEFADDVQPDQLELLVAHCAGRVKVVPRHWLADEADIEGRAG